MKPQYDPKELRVAAISVSLVALIFAAAFIQSYLAPPVHEVVIYEVFDVQHPANQYTVVYTRGQGHYDFHGVHDFQVGKSYLIKYIQTPDTNRDLTLLYFEEVVMPG